MMADATSRPAILMVEDDQFISTFLDARLKENYTTYVAPSTAEARKVLQANPVSLILLDLMLPDEDGFSFLGSIKKDAAHKDIPVIILSNFGQPEDQQRALRLGAVDFLVKANHTPTEIVTKIEAVLGSHPTTPS